MGVCCHSKSVIENQINDFWSSINLRETDPSHFKEMINIKSKIANGRVVAIDFERDFISNYFVNENSKQETNKFFKDLYETYTKDSDGLSSKYFFICFYFLTNNKMSANARRFFKETAQIFNFTSSENEKKVVTYKKDLLINITKFYVNLISLETVKNYTPVAINTSSLSLETAFSLGNQNEYVANLFNGFGEGPNLTLESFWSLYPTLSNDSGVRDSLMEIYLNSKKVTR